MRPYLLKGHERPLTQVKATNHAYGGPKMEREPEHMRGTTEQFGVATFHVRCIYAAAMATVTMFGFKWSLCIAVDSERLYTASADQTVRIWELQTGRELFQFKTGEPCRAVSLSIGEGLMAFTTDAFMGTPPQILVLKLEQDVKEQSPTPILSISAPKGRITRCYWTDLNRALITSHDGGILRRWDSETGKMLLEVQVHEDAIQDFQISRDGSHGITASLDKSAKLIDIETFEVLKTYKTGRFVNSAAISPIHDHVLLGGGQDASQVTTTSAKAGGFEARFFHKVFQEEFGNVRGHFGPINAVAFHPDGGSFTTGGEDGYVRIHHFDVDFHNSKFF